MNCRCGGRCQCSTDNDLGTSVLVRQRFFDSLRKEIDDVWQRRALVIAREFDKGLITTDEFIARSALNNSEARAACQAISACQDYIEV